MLILLGAVQLCRADVQTYCFGLAASMGAFLLGAGAKGKRYSMPNARIMIHQPLGGASGQAVDIEIQVSLSRPPSPPCHSSKTDTFPRRACSGRQPHLATVSSQGCGH